MRGGFILKQQSVEEVKIPKIDVKSFKINKFLKNNYPALVIFLVVVGGWELICTLLNVATYILPKPSDIFLAAQENWSNLVKSTSKTVFTSIIGFVISIVIGISVAVLLSLSQVIERAVYFYAIILQTIPVVAVAPIIVIWMGAGSSAIVAIVFLISFFPILSNTLIGLNSTDKNLKNLFFLYNTSHLQTIMYLRIPAALPFILAGLKISASLAVVGAIVGEYVAGIGGGSGGLGYSITIAASRLQTPYLFACGIAAAVLGITFYLIINAISNRLLKSWHESATDH